MASLGENAALAVIDMQEDFCPPNGALAVAEGRDIAPTINRLLALPFKTKFATQDYHPQDHCSFASQHTGAKAFTSTHTVRNPEASGTDIEEQTITLWPDHCVQGTLGCEIVPELDATRFHHFIKKGEDRRVEAYSAFGPPFRKPAVAMSRVSDLLHEFQIKRVFVCGLALDYCVKCSAIDAADAGYETYLVEDASRAVNQDEQALKANRADMEKHGVVFIQSDDAMLKS